MTDALALLSRPDWQETVREVLGTVDRSELLRRVDVACRTSLGAPLSQIVVFELSVGAAIGVLLANGRRAMIKAYAPSRPAEFVLAVHRVQSFLAAAAFPCPRPLAPPVPFGQGYAIAEELVDEGAQPDARRPEVRRVLAATLAELVRLTEPFRGETALRRGFSIVAGGVLWAKPHSPLFDFEATTAGAEWIDAIARDAQAKLAADRAPPVVGHSDWSVKHFRFVDGGIRVIYDWDSLTLERESFLVGTAAAHFTAAPPEWAPPTWEEATAFVDEYEAARGRAFTTTELAAVRAAYLYGTAYTARCQHALDPGVRGGGFRDALAEAAAKCAPAIAP